MSELQLSIRAENYDDLQLRSLSIIGKREREILDKLKGSSPLLLEGIRGSGKTTLLKLATVELSSEAPSKRIAGAYVSFSRYLLLENPRVPITASHPFVSWVSIKLLNAVYEVGSQLSGLKPLIPCIEPLLAASFDNIIANLEATYKQDDTTPGRFPGLSEEVSSALNKCSHPDYLRQSIIDVLKAFGLEKAILLCDEAAQHFKPDFQPLFFNVLKSIQCPEITFKAAIYPTITYFGSDFELGHDASLVTMTRPCLSSEWIDLCNQIIEKRYGGEFLKANPEYQRGALALSGFGIPRRFIELIGSVDLNSINEVELLDCIKNHTQRELLQPFEAIKARIPALVREVELAKYLLQLFIEDLKQDNLTRTYQTGFIAVSLHKAVPYAISKALKLLVYLGVLEKQATCKLGGASRETADRFLLNPAIIISEHLLASAQKKRISIAEMVDRIRRFELDKFKEYGRNNKALQDAVSDTQAIQTKPCPQCGTELPFDSRFCSNCGTLQVQTNILHELLNLPSSELELTPGVKSRLTARYVKVGDIFKATDTELDEIYMVGPTRVAIIRHAVDELLSG